MIQIDLASVAGQAAARELVRRSDVVVEPPFATAEVRCLNPRAICLTLPAFCPDDEHFADVEAAAGDFEACLLASLGVFQDMGLNRTLMGQRVSYSPLPLASAYSSVLAAYSVVMALLSREDTGLGEAVEVPLAAGCMDALVSLLLLPPQLHYISHCQQQ